MSGATLNLIAWSLLPTSSRPGWWTWIIGGAPMLLVLTAGTLAIILLTCRPEHEAHVRRDVILRHATSEATSRVVSARVNTWLATSRAVWNAPRTT